MVKSRISLSGVQEMYIPRVNVLKISHTKVSDKMAYANSADPDQTAPEGAV